MDRNQSNEGRFRDWVRGELSQLNRVMLATIQVIKHLEARIDATDGKPAKQAKPRKPSKT